MNCKTVEELKTKLSCVYENQFKGKMYNPSAIRTMYDRIIHLIKWSESEDVDNISSDEMQDITVWKEKLPDIDKLFGDVSQLYSDNIRKIAMKMLEVVVEYDNDYVTEMVCKVPKGNGCTSSDFLFNLPFQDYQNVTLVAHPEPVKFASIMFKSILDEIKEKIGSLYKLQQTYTKSMELWQTRYEKIRATFKREDDIAREETDMMERKPKLSFPEEFQINTSAFLKKRDISRENARFPLQLESINIDNMTNEDLILLLYAGVGVYSEMTDLYYRKTVLEFMSEGRLEFIVSDVCYGMDYPIGCLFISKEFSDSQGLNTLYQLMSRVGRGRMSYMGHIFIDESCMPRILEPIDETSSVELKNMETVLRSL
jgi:hypothetical protein